MNHDVGHNAKPVTEGQIPYIRKISTHMRNPKSSNSRGCPRVECKKMVIIAKDI